MGSSIGNRKNSGMGTGAGYIPIPDTHTWLTRLTRVFIRNPGIHPSITHHGLYIYCAENGYWTRSKVKTEIANKNNLLKINNLKLLIQ